MAFLNSFGRKTADATAKLSQQAKILSETTRLQSLIAEENQKIEKMYTGIGKLYAAHHRTDYEEIFADMMTSIAQSEDSIAGYKKQILEAKGVIICEKCGAEVSKDAAFCSSCGAPVLDPTKYVKCAHCGAVMEKGMKFCTACGKPLPEQKTETKHTCPKCGAEASKDAAFCCICGTALPKEEKAEETISRQKTCPKCGTEVAEGQLFCTKCGEPLTVAPEPLAAETIVVGNPYRPRICPDCGAELSDDVLFCTECGRRL